MEKERFINRYFIIVCFIALAINTVFRMLDSNLAPYANEVWGSKTLGGYLSSTFNIGSICMAFFAGRLTRVWGKRSCLLVATLVFAVAAFAMGIFEVPSVGLTMRLLQGMSKGLIMVTMTSIVVDVVARNRMNEGMGIYNIPQTLSYAIGPLLGLNLAVAGGYPLMFIMCALFCVVAAVLSLGETYEKKPEYQKKLEAKQEIDTDKEYKGVWKFLEKCALLPSIVNTIFMAGFSCILIFGTIYAQEVLELSASQIGFFYTAAAVAMVIARLACNRLADRFGALVMVIPGMVCMAMSIVFLAFFAKQSYVFFLAAGCLYGVGDIFTIPTLNACAVVDSPAKRGDFATGTFWFTMDFGVLFGSTFYGMIIDAAANVENGYTHMWMVGLVILLGALALSIILFNNKARAARRKKNGIVI
ncbi:MAG: MFS transporter [Lachnospiraceae bacterium]|nr:MFS transporter [Lachnospiraceae bacterium]